MDQHSQPAMKLFRLPGGLTIWNSPEAGGETKFLYREIFRRHCYEKHGVRVGHGSVIFDVGANVGLFALSLLERLEGVHLFCFEPVPSTYACLARNLEGAADRSRNQVTALNVALGAAEGETTIEFFPGAPGNSTLYAGQKHRDFPRIVDGVHWSDLWRTQKTRAVLCLPLFPLRRQLLRPSFERVLAGGVRLGCGVRTLSAVVGEHVVERIDLLKIDVEGAEFDVLAGIEERHWPLVRQIAMEIEPANKPRLDTVVAGLRAKGFSRVVVESMFDGPSDRSDAVPASLYAVR